ncbi:MAG: hypothetical protein HY326_09220 [Chloroflexi bacterium]|nr:hypothetical protein [Chloroflexota bacterium]
MIFIEYLFQTARHITLIIAQRARWLLILALVVGGSVACAATNTPVASQPQAKATNPAAVPQVTAAPPPAQAPAPTGQPAAPTPVFQMPKAADVFAMEQKWKDQKIRDYRITVELQAFSPVSITLTVKDGAVVEAIQQDFDNSANTWGQVRAGDKDTSGALYSVPGLFNLIFSELQNKRRSVAVEYDSQYFFPSRVKLGEVNNDGKPLANSNQDFMIKHFEPIKPGS